MNNWKRLVALVKKVKSGGILFISERLFNKAMDERPENALMCPYWVSSKWNQHGVGNGMISNRTIATIL